MNFKKNILVLLVLMFVVVGCGTKDDESAGTVIRFATWDSEENLDWQEELVKEFNDSQDEILVKLEAYGSEYDTKLTAGLGAGDAPDVMYMWNYPQYHEALLPLDEYLESEGLKDKYYDALWNYNAIDNVVYGIPIGFSTHVVYYNKDLFEQAGVAEPSENWTWDEFEAAAKKISTLGDDIFGVGVPVKPDPYDFEMHLWSNGGSFADENGNLEGALNSDASIKTFEKFQKMIKEETALVTEKSGSDEFATGNIGMYIYGSWSIGKFQDEEVNFGLAKLPVQDEGSVSILSSSGMSVYKDTEKKEAALEFLKFWTGKRAVEVRMAYELPPLHEVVEESEIDKDPMKGMFYQMLEQSDGYVPSSFKIEGWSEVSQNISEGLERMFNPNTLEEPKEVIEDILSRQ